MHMQGTEESLGCPLLMLSALFPHDSFSRGAWSSFLLGCLASTLSGPACHCFPMGEFIGPRGLCLTLMWVLGIHTLVLVLLKQCSFSQSLSPVLLSPLSHCDETDAAEHGQSWWSSACSARPVLIVLSVLSSQCADSSGYCFLSWPQYSPELQPPVSFLEVINVLFIIFTAVVFHILQSSQHHRPEVLSLWVTTPKGWGFCCCNQTSWPKRSLGGKG